MSSNRGDKMDYTLEITNKIKKEAEEEALRRGCGYVFLDTFSFQAPLFYKKHGYKEQFVLEKYPVIGERYYYTKKLDKQ